MISNWYALAVKPRKEEYVERQLVRLGKSVICPRYLKFVRHARQSRKIRAPLFPGYVFVEFDAEARDWRKVNWVPGSIGFVKFDNRPAALNSEFVREFIVNVTQTGIVEFSHKFKIGDRVQAIGGPFDQQVGEVIEMSDDERVKILMEALGRKVEMTLPKKSIVGA